MSKPTVTLPVPPSLDREISFRQIGIGLVVSLLIRFGVTGEDAANIATVAAPLLLWAYDRLAFRVKAGRQRDES